MAGRKRIVVAMSGGVDSSTTAALLHEQGHEVTGIGLRFPQPRAAEESEWGCCGVRGMDDARRAAARIGIPFYALNYEDIFKQAVIDYFCSSYLDGRTPNPCIECNRVVKFGRLLKLADALEADHLATGHYARIGRDARTGRHVLKRGVDAEKDQSYFLYPLSQEQLSRALFPLGEMTKRETRELARSFGLKVCDKPASQDVCFVGTGDYRRYLAERFPESVRPGPIVDGQGRVVGAHGGIAFYTVGQRKRLGVAAGERLYVLSVDARTATIVVGGRDEMRTDTVSVREVNWIAFEEAPGPVELNVRLRYREPEVAAEVLPGDEGRAEVRFTEPHARVGAGQSAVFYDGDVVVGGGIIE
ncbi:MAG: tRNA 2-thiouridine(34) synthase MnmA [Candidatus Brocadiia bacterium]|nr:tRNA 2-thiouridine(34) synthase MnmA [Candidatus Brocadiia bacterium]